MTVTIRAIETAVPPTALRQPAVRDLLAAQPAVSGLGRRLIRASFDASGIDTRHSVLAELDADSPLGPGATPLLYDPATGRILSPSTGARNDGYVREAPKLFAAAASAALKAVPELGPDDVTHVVTVSCTGFFAPGPDYVVVRALGLRPSTQRYHLGFMGCYGAFPALRLATAACEADPDAVVLIVCAELCSLHLHVANDADVIVSSSVFADGAAAAVVTARPVGNPGLQVQGMASALTADGEHEMTWTVGDHGFDMVLSGAVPRLIEAEIAAALQPLLAPVLGIGEMPAGAVQRWAIHPGGRSILDRVERAVGLSADQLEPSRNILRRYGNMSSATILFILRTHLHAAAAEDDRICAMAFGPGLTVESALLRRTSGR